MNGYISNAIDEDEDNYDETVYAAINKVKYLLIIVLGKDIIILFMFAHILLYILIYYNIKK